MQKALLVDDELFIRKGLRSLIDWEKCGFEVSDEADNGEDAYEIIKQTKPALVITDIRMPVLDGLGLIKRVVESTKLDVTPKFIVISGYNDFKYAQHALRYGVHDFILKPIDQDEMEEALRKLSSSIRSERTKNKMQELLYHQVMFEDLLAGELSEREEAQLEKTYRINEQRNHYYVMIEIFNQNLNHAAGSQLKEELQGILYETLKVDIPIHEHPEYQFGMIINSDDLKAFHNDLSCLLSKLSSKISCKKLGKSSFYVGSAFRHINGLKESFRAAKHTALFKFSKKESGYINYDVIKDHQVTYSELDHDMCSLLMEQIEENNHEFIVKFVGDIFTVFEKDYYAPEAIKGSINYCVHQIIKTMKSMEENDKDYSSYYTSLPWNRYNLDPNELKQQFEDYLLESALKIHQLRKECVKGDIRKIKAYVERNFQKNLSLKAIANKFYINPVYMGQLFKKTYGIYFKEFLLDLRIKEAKKLLRQTGYRVYEVAEMVGFGSTDYFVTQFEKMEGMSPTEYRKQILD